MTKKEGLLFGTQVRGGDKKAIKRLVRLVRAVGKAEAARELGVTERSVYNYLKLPLVEAVRGKS